ncbi:MAG: TniQ family protein [Bacilli bacterium]|jgi:hypothetical protein|nr:TniQ family protein [Bacilli bacterium]
MIKKIERIYPGETAYSYLARQYAHGGFVFHEGFVQEALARPNEYPDPNFINRLNEGFKKEMSTYVSFEDLILKHTLFNYYARFLPLDRRSNAYAFAMTNMPKLANLLQAKVLDRNCIRYCPKCVDEDREEFGESYIHVKHCMPSIRVCWKHGCDLVSTQIKAVKAVDSSFTPLELLIGSHEVRQREENDVNFMIARYVSDIFDQPFDLENQRSFGAYLTGVLDDEFCSERGERKDLDALSIKMNGFYRDLLEFHLTKRRISRIYRGLSFNPYDLALVAFFQGIRAEDLCAQKGYPGCRWESFDKDVRKMYEQGHSVAQIAISKNVCHEVIREVLMGAYDKEPNKNARFRPKKTNWAVIDDAYCLRFNEAIKKALETNPGARISKAFVAGALGLRDKSLRNFPKVRQLTKEASSTLIRDSSPIR